MKTAHRAPDGYAGDPPRWAVALGSDPMGSFADFAVGPVRQRMRWIPPGRFRMGAPAEAAVRFDDEGPLHEVELRSGFWLGETPVTQALWAAVMGENPSRFAGAMRPVERVSWVACQAFCERANRAVGGLLLRLPTEAEWEYACRAGTEGATWLGELEISALNLAPLLDEIAWYEGNSWEGYAGECGYDLRLWTEEERRAERAGTRVVKGKRPNPWGLYDMLGNVNEWCEDAYGAYSGSSCVDPVVRAGANKVTRGGSWFSDPRIVRAAARNWNAPENRGDILGFRVAQGADAP